MVSLLLAQYSRPSLLVNCAYQGFIQDFRQEGANIAIIRLRGGRGPYYIFRICWSGNLNNYSNKGGLGVLPQEDFEIYDI